MDDEQNGTLGLPLLIVNGKFKNINSMTAKDLETFIPFLTTCSVVRAGAKLNNGIPEWWASTIQYKFPLKKPNGLSQTGYRSHLLALVCRCYWYHDAEFLINFCGEVADHPETVYFVNNPDNTTSIFYVKNTIHIMTFNNENKEYDMNPERKDKTPRRCLLPTVTKKPTAPVITDVYLCEKCDDEFSSLSEMVKHEKECYGASIDYSEDRQEEAEDSSDEIEILSHIKPPPHGSPLAQNGFLRYFQLRPKNAGNGTTPCKSRKNSLESPSKRWVSVDMCLHKNRSVEFSSFSGKKMLERHVKRDLMQRTERNLATIESYCYTSNRTSRELKEHVDAKVTYRSAKKTSWSHQYCFNRKQRLERYITLKTGLDERSRKLLKSCKPNKVVLTRLKLPQADYYRVRQSTRNPKAYIITPDEKTEEILFVEKNLPKKVFQTKTKVINKVLNKSDSNI